MASYSMTLRQKMLWVITLAAAPTGTWYGSVIITGSERETSFPFKKITDTKYQCEVLGFRVGRVTAETMKIVWGDDTGVAVDSSHDLTVTEPSESLIPEPMVWLKDTLLNDWDTNYLPLPLIEYEDQIKARRQEDLSPVYITVSEGTVMCEPHAQGRYKNAEYPVEITVRSEGRPNSRELCKMGFGEVKKIVEGNWNNILVAEFDYVKFDDDGVNLSMEYAGKYEWRWRIRLMGVMRGRYGTPIDPSS